MNLQGDGLKSSIPLGGYSKKYSNLGFDIPRKRK